MEAKRDKEQGELITSFLNASGHYLINALADFCWLEVASVLCTRCCLFW